MQKIIKIIRILECDKIIRNNILGHLYFCESILEKYDVVELKDIEKKENIGKFNRVCIPLSLDEIKCMPLGLSNQYVVGIDNYHPAYVLQDGVIEIVTGNIYAMVYNNKHNWDRGDIIYYNEYGKLTTSKKHSFENTPIGKVLYKEDDNHYVVKLKFNNMDYYDNC